MVVFACCCSMVAWLPLQYRLNIDLFFVFFSPPKPLSQRLKKIKTESKPAYELHGHCDLVYHATFNPNRQRIVSASHDMSLRMWQIIPTVPDVMVLPPVTNELKTNSIKLSWRSPSENGYPISNYIVQIKREDQTDWHHQRRLSTCMSHRQFYRDPKRETVIAQLRSGSFYQFRLAAINRVGMASFSPTTSEVRTEPDIPEEIVQRAECVGVYPRAMTLQWKRPNSWGIPIKSCKY